MAITQKQKESRAKVEKNKLYSLEEASTLLKEITYTFKRFLNMVGLGIRNDDIVGVGPFSKVVTIFKTGLNIVGTGTSTNYVWGRVAGTNGDIVEIGMDEHRLRTWAAASLVGKMSTA